MMKPIFSIDDSQKLEFVSAIRDEKRNGLYAGWSVKGCQGECFVEIRVGNLNDDVPSLPGITTYGEFNDMYPNHDFLVNTGRFTQGKVVEIPAVEIPDEEVKVGEDNNVVDLPVDPEPEDCEMTDKA